MLSVYIVYRMHKVERRMVKTNAMNTQGDKIIDFLENVFASFSVAGIYCITRGSNMCCYLTTNE